MDDDIDDQPNILYKDTFAVAAAGGAEPQGDKILLPPSALQGLLDASALAQRQQQKRPGRYGDYGDYASDGFSGRPADAELPQPLTFRLVNAANQRAVYAGIREFSAAEGQIVLSAYLRAALGSDDSEAKQVTVSLHRLPKGTFVHLRPLAAGYAAADWRALLERQLREGYTTLTRGAELTVRHSSGDNAAPFRFRVDGFRPPGEGVCVVDTDLEVDIEALDEAQAQATAAAARIQIDEKPTSAADATSPGGVLDIFKPVSGQVRPGDYVDYELPAWDRSRPLAISLSDLDDDDGYAVDLLVSPLGTRQRALPRETEHVWANFGAVDGRGCKTVTMAPSNVELEGAEALRIAVHGYGAASPGAHPFTLRARTVVEEEQEVQQQQQEQTHSPDEAQCANCRQWVPARSMVLHESFCRRNNAVCPHCSRVFQARSDAWAQHWHCDHDGNDGAHGDTAASRAKHEALFHGAWACPAACCQAAGVAGGFASATALAQHRTTTCPAKRILCQFCHLEVAQEGDAANPMAAAAETALTGQTPHERADGARTTECHVCDAIVRLRDVAAHLRHHALDRQRRPPPALCRDVLCGRTQNETTNSDVDRLGLCATCFAPLYVSAHDPSGRQLRRRVERRYLAQLLTGCGKPWCANPWCKTGRLHQNQNQQLPPLDGGVAQLLPRIQPLLAALADPQLPLHFCVDESSQQRRAVADMIAAAGRYALPWCVAACEAVGPDASKAWEWLSTWAPEVTEV